MNNIDHIYALYINEYEHNNISKKLKKHNINATYILGINGKEELHDEFNNQTKIKTIGAYGHIHSFIIIIQNAIKNNYKNILILEADIYISSKFNKDIQKYNNLSYKLLYLGASQHNWTPKNSKKHNYYYAHNTYGTFALAINHTIFKEYLTELQKLQLPSDTCLLKIQQKYYGSCYVTYPNLIICDVTKSSTSKERNQCTIMQTFKWNSALYDMTNYYEYIVNPYDTMIIIELNSIDPNKTGSIQLNDATYYLPNNKYKYVYEYTQDNDVYEKIIYCLPIPSNITNMYCVTHNLYIKSIYLE